MNFSKKHWFKIVLVVYVFTQNASILAFNTDDYDDFDYSTITLDQLDTFERENPPDIFAFRSIDPSVLAQLLYKLDITEPLWNSTEVPAGRDILYHFPYARVAGVEYGGLACNFFFNMTDQMKVTVADVFNFENFSSIQNLIQGLIPGISEQNFEQLIPLFKKITLQERKSGLFLQGGFLKGPFTIQLNTSLQLGARNFWLNKKDADAIKAVFSQEFSDTDFDEGELYKIRFGMGDTRVKLGLNSINMTSFQTDIGFEAILPTSRLSYTPSLTLGIVQVPFNDEDENVVRNALAALFAIRDNLINPRLGNDGHFGFGCYLESRVDIFHALAQLWIRASYDHLFPNEEDRLFLFKQTLTRDDLLNVMNDPAGQATVNNYIQQYLFPSSFKSTVYPGGVTNFVCAINTDFARRWKGGIGYDFYAKQREYIKKIHNTTVELQALDLDKAQAPRVSQHKLFAEVFYHNKKETSDCGVGLGGDVTVSAEAIGHDWTIYLKVASSF